MACLQKLVIGRAHGGDESVYLAGVLDAPEGLAVGTIGLDAGTDINGQRESSRAHLQDAIGHVCRRESTRQNEVRGDVWWKE
ncbi:MAG: hypothetical protein AUI84_01725 [Delftia sp. 13_1_40CM_3_66_6]|nr:MAG: hypothetical protein AUG53_04450 [Delftia sp. 13_1_20CM_4_67_18]OLE95870.1 MAG: hypothetical protein AUI84_01725 [Delftia sp. 13_1_40CM_3_66_6]